MGQDEPKVDVDDVSLRVQENVPIVPECVFGCACVHVCVCKCVCMCVCGTNDIIAVSAKF